MELRTLDEVVDAWGIEPTLIKCDVEGHEAEVFSGGERTLRSALPTLVVEIEQRHQARPVDHVFETLLDFGYAGWSVTRAGLAPLTAFDVERDQLAHLDAHGEVARPNRYVNNFLFAGPGRLD